MKNPLYVVKGKDVHPAFGWVDMLIKKFDLEPMIRFLQQMMEILIAQVQNYAVFSVIKAWFDQVMSRLAPLLAMIPRSH